MILEGYTPSTRRRYVGKIHALFQKWQNNPIANPFDNIRELKEIGSDIDIRRASKNLECADRLFDKGNVCADSEIINIFFYLLYDVEATLADVINLTFDCNTYISQCNDIIENMQCKGRKRYVFGLCQGKKRNTQILRELVNSLHSVLKVAGMTFGDNFSREDITAMWISAALKADVPPATIKAIVPSLPHDYRFLKFVEADTLSEYEKASIIQKVANAINDNTPYWFAMHLRGNNTPQDVYKAIEASFPNLLPTIAFYYPTHTEYYTDNHNKKTTREVPYLPNVLFFRMRKDKVRMLFAAIGNLAWCYRHSNNPNSPYCTIAYREMLTFQRFVGQFSTDVHMELTRRYEPFPTGARVKISGGTMAGRIGIIENVKNADGSRTYTLSLSEHDYASWTVRDVDEVLIEQIRE